MNPGRVGPVGQADRLFRGNQFLELVGKHHVDGVGAAQGISFQMIVGLVDVEIDQLDEETVDRIDMLRDMEGEVFSNVQANCDKNGFEAMTVEEIGEKLRDMDVIVPYGII